MLDLFYRFGSSPNWDGYCNLEVDKVVERQSTESDIEKRKRRVGDRAKTGRGRRSANHLLQPLCILLAASGEKLDDDGQQQHHNFRLEDVWLDK